MRAALGGLLAAPLFSPEASAGRYEVASERDLHRAILRANHDDGTSATITLKADIILRDTALLPVALKPITVDTGSFVLSAAGAAGNGPVLGGGRYVLIGTLKGGDNPHDGESGRGGVGTLANGGEVINHARVTGGSGTNTAAGSAVPGSSGPGGAGMSLSGTELRNDATGRITGGRGGRHDGALRGGDTARAGGGGTGLLMRGSGLTNNGQITGGAGGDAVNRTSAGTAAFAGRGGDGARMTGGSHANSGTIAGGSGGIGARADISRNGAGGDALVLTGGTLANHGVLRGGHGGTNPARGPLRPGASGGAGGHGAVLAHSILVNGRTGLISGGGSAAEAGGAGLAARSATVINSGGITGGHGADAARQGKAIEFQGDNNLLELRDGSHITGTVAASAGDTLILGGATDSSFSVASIGSRGQAAQYQGFSNFEVLTSATWRLHGTTAAITPWQLNEGTLTIEDDASLGARSGTLIFAGGTLRILGTAVDSLERPVHWAHGGGGFDIADPEHHFNVRQDLHGSGRLHKQGPGTLALTGTNSYTGGTTVSDGILKIGNGGTQGSIAGDVHNDGLLAFDRSDALDFGGRISGKGALYQIGTGTVTLTADHDYTGPTVIHQGALKLGDGGTSGHVRHDIYNHGTLIFDRADTMMLAQDIHGGVAAPVIQRGAGTTVLTGTNDYQGPTDIQRGTLVMNSEQNDATGAITVRSGAKLQGNGRSGGAVTVEDGGTLAPGHPAGTLTVAGLVLHPGATLHAELGSPTRDRLQDTHDHIRVNGDLTLDGFLDIDTTADGAFDPGVYRLIDYHGTLTDRTLDIRRIPPGSERTGLSVQTSIPGQVNVLHTGGQTIRLWEGEIRQAQGRATSPSMPGGSGVWSAGGLADWSDGHSTAEKPWATDALAVFLGTPGTVTVDNGAGPVVFAGAQFAVDGYTIAGPGTLTTTTAHTTLRVGDGTKASSDMRATVNAAIAGPGGIVKMGQGTLVLDGDNSYAGSTMLAGGTLEIARDRNLGAGGPLAFAGGRLRATASFDTMRPVKIFDAGGAIDTGPHAVRLAGPLSGAGNLRKEGAGVLELAGPNTASGTVMAVGGTIRAGTREALGPASRYAIEPGAALDLAGHDQTVAGLANAGSIAMGAISPATQGTGAPVSNAGAAPGRASPGTTLTVRGDYVGRDGILLLRTTLGDDHSATDRLVIDGGRASGHTTVRVINMDGLGAQTRGDGIEVIRAMNGAVTTAQTSQDAFSLAGEHVDAGAFEYRLYPADAHGAGESWYLRSTGPAPAPAAPAGTAGDTVAATAGDPVAATARRAGFAPPPGRTAYRPEIGLHAALPAVLNQGDLAVLGNLHQREGDSAIMTAPDPATPRRRVWGRLVNQDNRIRQSGTTAPRSTGWSTGMQVGMDLLAGVQHRLGLYGATLGWRSTVNGSASGRQDASLGQLRGRSQYAGLYWTYTGDAGWYSDVVLQYGRQRGSASGPTGRDDDIRGHGMLVSAEMGKSLALGGRWTAEPQAQIVGSKHSLDDVEIPAATLHQDAGTTVTARLGLRLKGDYQNAAGRLQPYSRLNVWHGLQGTDTLSVQGPAGRADVDTRRGYTSGEIAAGGTWTLNPRFALYGEVGHMFPLGGTQRVSAQHTVSAGVRIAW
jgi:autotransporter-associated beta strand protein